ncbi:hypothetical protein PRIPAC_92587 [Pristionchus pacificus]|uniref:Uncharacterized protein n=1 Tax=Pristionchus pacificus TaxID=54126 RepID=A0A2A6B9W7_PRIPA|nr:hypothetical protein PRIPAC_92587 [Pristionchus pacificus]|eukprot:PDM62654.1 hypothetical protein PRIPAC_49869 [Pristionchus pacificus]
MVLSFFLPIGETERNEKVAVWMNSMYGGDAPPGPSIVYGREEGRIEGDGNGVETTGDAAYYQVTSGGEYAHHYTTPNGQYESLARAVVNPDGSIQEQPQPHRPIPIHPSTGITAIPPTPINGPSMNGLPKRDGSEELVEDTGSNTRASRNSRSKSTSIDMDQLSYSERDSLIKRKKADQAKARYHRMSEEERKEFNLRRRLKQRGTDESGLPLPPTPRQLDRVSRGEGMGQEGRNDDRALEHNRRKAQAARIKYHQMSEADKKEYNLRRTEQFRRKRREEELLMMSPAMRISQESYDKAQAIMSRNSRKALAARERYARMSVEERKQYNQRRAETKKRREREALLSKMRIEDDGMEGMRHLCEASEVAREMEGYESYPKEDGPSTRDDDDDDETEDVEVDDGPLTLPPPLPEAPSSSSSALLPPLNSSVTPSIPPSNRREEREGRGRGGGREGGDGGAKRRGPARTAQRIIQAVQEAHSNLEYERRRSEYEENWSMHQGSSLEGVMIEDGTRVVYTDETGENIEVGDELHHMQARSASAGVYAYADHTMNDHYVEGPDMVQHEVEVPHSPHHTMHHIHHMDGDIDVEHADEDDMTEEWDSEAQLLNISDRPYQPRVKSQIHMVQLDGPDSEIQLARLAEQRARRAQRSRRRYANMNAEEKARHNAERAKQLREARRRDMQLIQMADSEEVMMDEGMRKMVEAAQERRNRRAEQARHKYRRMSEDERRAYNAMRDAQRRSRRRDLEGLSDGEDGERGTEEIRRVRGGGRSTSTSVSTMGVRGGGGGSGGGGASTTGDDHHHHLHRGGVTSDGHYAYEMYEDQEWTGDH